MVKVRYLYGRLEMVEENTTIVTVMVTRILFIVYQYQAPLNKATYRGIAKLAAQR